MMRGRGTQLQRSSVDLRLALIIGIAVVGAIAILIGSKSVAPRPMMTITYEGTKPQFTLSDLVRQAEVIALVRIEVLGDARWGSADNKQWEPELLEPPAFIYTDDRAAVTRVLKGSLSGFVTIRRIGGVVGDVHMVAPDEPEWKAGHDYLVLLEQREMPTKEGRETAWRAVFDSDGAFAIIEPGRYRQLGGHEWTATEAEILKAAIGS